MSLLNRCEACAWRSLYDKKCKALYLPDLQPGRTHRVVSNPKYELVVLDEPGCNQSIRNWSTAMRRQS